MSRRAGDEDDERIRMSNVRQWLIQDFQNRQPTQVQVQSPDLSSAEASDDDGGANPVMLKNLDMLDCPICIQPLNSPIYQCENGHIICSSCCVKSNEKCPSCRLPVGSIRSRALETLIESLNVECKNKKFGCKEMLIYNRQNEHEDTCPHIACICPVSSCTFSGSFKNMYSHFSTHHSSSATSFTYNKSFFLPVSRTQKYVFLQEKNEGVIFILNHDESQPHGTVVNVDCVGPKTLKNAFVYRLTFKCLETSLILETVPEVCAKWQEHTPVNCYLTIPPGFWGFHEVCIKKMT